jgi:hypothetical protein
MMQIVIDIPEEIYDFVQNTSFVEDESTLFKQTNTERQKTLILFDIIDAIRNGIPLPEHHGRLGDLDALEEYFRNVRKELKASDYKNGIEFFVRDEMLLNVQQFIHLCDAIIEGSDSE